MKKLLCVIAAVIPSIAHSEEAASPEPRNETLSAWFQAETAKLEEDCLADVQTAHDWRTRQKAFRGHLQGMLGLDPWPERTALKATVTGTLDHPEFTVENLHYQSRPGLYVTANLYLPKDQPEPVPAILYVCGHGKVIIDGISYGNKVNYQHHAAWFARNGYACLIIDTLQLGEIEGIHHGTCRHDRWWWHARGYTPAGVEAWNGIRGIDYLQSRPEVDPKRIGITGRSGGGAYSWWIAALDERVKCAVPVAGVTSMRNHIVDGCIEGHCDCMFMVNQYRWDFAQLCALIAPRPLLIVNTDKDRIFPLDGVIDVYTKTRRIYELLGVKDKIGLTIVEGPHKDTQPIRVPAFHWFERHLKGKETTDTFEMAAVKFFEPQELKVFRELPADEKNTIIDESFVPLAPAPTLPANRNEWSAMRDGWMTALREEIFSSWPTKSLPSPAPVESATDKKKARLLVRYNLDVAPGIQLPLYVSIPTSRNQPVRTNRIVLTIHDTPGWNRFLNAARNRYPGRLFRGLPADTTAPSDDTLLFGSAGDTSTTFAWFSPRGLGSDQWAGTSKHLTHLQRRFALLGQTTDTARAWDLRSALMTLATIETPSGQPPQIEVRAKNLLAGNALYAALFEPAVTRLDLTNLPSTHHDGPYFLGILRVLDTPQAVALAAEKSKISLRGAAGADWRFPLDLARRLNWNEDQVILLPE